MPEALPVNAEYSSLGSLLGEMRSLFPTSLLGGSGWGEADASDEPPACLRGRFALRV